MLKPRFLYALMSFLSLVAMLLPSEAQNQPILTVTIPPFWDNFIDETVLADFEAQHNVDVQFILADFNEQSPTSTDDLEDYADNLAEYASSADVYYVNSSWFGSEVTRANIALDLTPLTQSDANLNPDDFHNVAWQSFQWDGSMWALPIAVEPLLIDYLPAAFDAAGIAYPNETWTISDFAYALRELTEYNADGTVSLPAMTIDNNSRLALFRALLGQSLYDANAFPQTPILNHAELASILEQWVELEEEGVIATGGFAFGERFFEIPLRIGGGGGFGIIVSSDSNEETPRGALNAGFPEQPTRALAALPNGQNLVSATGFAVSSGATNPSLAYELARYLSEQERIAQSAFGADPARKSYAETDMPTQGAIILSGADSRTPEAAALVADVLENGLSASELRFSAYLDLALNDVRQGTDGVSALQSAELTANEILDAVDALELPVTVTEPTPVVLAAGEIAINFGMQSFTPQLPNQSEWDAAIDDFVSQDPQVGNINLDMMGFQDDMTTYDCSYISNTLMISIDPETLLALDPLLYSDTNLFVGDFAVGALEALQLDGIAYGLPLTIQPQVLTYNPASFASVGVAEPVNGWTSAEFLSALQALKSIVAEDETPFVGQTFGNSHLLMMIAAQGGLPFNTQGTSIVLDFTSPETVSAIQEVLDWAKNGYIDYQAQSGGGMMVQVIGGDSAAPISSNQFFGLDFGGRGGGPFGGDGQARQAVTLPTTYPTGINYTPVSFDVGGGYISKTTAYPEACYRWLSYLAVHSELFLGAMPALLTELDTPEVQISLGASLEVYQQVAQTMSAANTVNLNIGDPFISTWLNTAMDAYVQNDADLLTELQNAQQYTQEYLDCVAGLDVGSTLFDRNECVSQVSSTGL